MTSNEDPYLRSLHHINTRVIPTLQEQCRCSHPDRKLRVKFIVDESRKGKDQFQSVTIFGTIVYEEEPRGDEELGSQATKQEAKSEVKPDGAMKRVIIKMQIGDETSLSWNNGGVQFFNEVTLYKDFLPYFSQAVPDIQETFPSYVYGCVPETESRLEDILILEDLCKEGYRLTTSKTGLRLDHILLAMASLGRFHACSYIMKSIDKENFLKKVNLIKQTRAWIEDRSDFFQEYIATTGGRGVKYLEQMPGYEEKLGGVRHFLKNIGDSLPRVYQVSDRTSVLCHGDFCRNNMFFKYGTSENRCGTEGQTDGEVSPSDDTPVSVKLFDMATIVYGSPALDLAFFLYLNSTQEQRTHHWDTMLGTYYATLKETCNSYERSSGLSRGSNDSPGSTNAIAVPTLEEIRAEFKVKSMMGYLTCAYFLPIMMQENSQPPDYKQMPRDELIEYILSLGGDEATKAVGDILRHVVDSGFM